MGCLIPTSQPTMCKHRFPTNRHLAKGGSVATAVGIYRNQRCANNDARLLTRGFIGTHGFCVQADVFVGDDAHIVPLIVQSRCRFAQNFNQTHKTAHTVILSEMNIRHKADANAVEESVRQKINVGMGFVIIKCQEITLTIRMLHSLCKRVTFNPKRVTLDPNSATNVVRT